jgi:pyruvate dehydrogenase E2 component (dihydrolipoamide acetyltransferase)
MSVSVTMPQLGESVTEGTVTRWLKKEGERVEADEPLLEVSTDKVDTEIPSPASGILRSIAVDEDETVAVGAQLAVIEDSETSDSAPDRAGPPAQDDAAAPQATAESAPAAAEPEPAPASSDGWSAPSYAPPAPAPPAPVPAAPTPGYAPPPSYGQPATPAAPPYAPPAAQAPATQPAAAPSSPYAASTTQAPAGQPPVYAQPTTPVPPAPTVPPPAAAETTADAGQPAAEEEYPPPTPLPGAGEAPYVTPLVRKLAAEHAVNLETVTGTGVGGRIRKQDVIEAARTQRESQVPGTQAPQPPQAPQAEPAAVVPQQAQPLPAPAAKALAAQPAAAQPAAAPAARPAVVPSSLRGTTQRMSRLRQVIAQRMVESLQVSAQLTTVVEADVTAIARLRDRAKADFEAREGVKLTFLPFFALAAVEALKMHPKLNAAIDGDQVTYYDAEHLGVAVDTERGLLVPVIHNAGDLNIGGLARKIGDLAQRTRSGQVGPDELAGGTFTLTNTGSRGVLFDTPIINQPQVAILGTGTVVRRPVVVEDPALGEVIAVRSMVYLALTYDHRLVDGADAARFLATVKNRLEEGAFETELGL